MTADFSIRVRNPRNHFSGHSSAEEHLPTKQGVAGSNPAGHDFFMDRALSQARLAVRKGEVPVGAVIVRAGRILARAHNRTRLDRDPTAHAEMVALRAASKLIGNERLLDCALVVTLEPCAMCAGAIIQARIPTLVYGTKDPKAGACGSALRVIPNKKLNHSPAVISGVRARDAAALLTDFFKARRKMKRAVL